MNVRLEKTLSALLQFNILFKTIIKFIFNTFLHVCEIESQVLFKEILIDDVKSKVNGIMNLLKDILHIGSKGSIVIDVE